MLNDSRFTCLCLPFDVLSLKNNSIPNFRIGCLKGILLVGNEIKIPRFKTAVCSHGKTYWSLYETSLQAPQGPLLRLSLPAHSGSEDLASGHLSHPWWAARITGGVFFTTKDLDLPKSWIELKNLGNIPFYQGSSYDSPTHSHLSIRKEAPAS